MAVILLRVMYALAALAAAAAFFWIAPDAPSWLKWGMLLALPAAVIALDTLLRPKHVGVVSALLFGTLAGFLLSAVAALMVNPLLLGYSPQAQGIVHVGLLLALSYLCTSLLLQTRGDFRVLIPFVELTGKSTGHRRPYLLDTSVVIDGRIADIEETGIIDAQLVVPRFVVAELQAIADSTDKLRRNRGRRGLDILNRLRGNARTELVIEDRELPEFAGQPVDQKLVLLARHLDGKVVTNDYNLNKVARLHDVDVLNINDLANAVKPVCIPGESLNVQIIRAGEQQGQGVGFLDDGTMVVVEAGRDHIGQHARIVVTSVTQTSAGRMIFGRYEAPMA